MFQSMRSSCTLLFLIALAFTFQFLTAPRASAQGPVTGTPPFGSFGGGPDVINLANLNSHIDIPVLNKPGRGSNFSYGLRYDSSVWYPATESGSLYWLPTTNTNWGWTTSMPRGGYVSYSTVSTWGWCIKYSTKWTLYRYENWIYHDGFGTPHPFGINVQGTLKTGCQTGSTGSQGTATDGSGYTISVFTNTVNSLYAADGASIITAAISLTDRNGNQITSSNASGTTSYYDTLSSTVPVLAISGSGTSTSPLVYSYTAPSGSAASYTASYVEYTVATNFAVSGISEYGAHAVYLVDKITLPDSSYYQFTYEATPSSPSSGACTPLSGTYQTNCVTARIWKVRLPTGGQIIYTYSGGAGTNGSGIWSDGSAATLQRQTPDGTWTYAQVKGTGAASTTTVTDPSSAANQISIQFQGIYETQRLSYQGSISPSNLLQTINTCYNGVAPPCTTTAITAQLAQRTVNAILPGSANLQAQHKEIYDSYGNVTEADDYDFGSGAIGPLLKKTTITYATLTNIESFQQQVTVTNGSGATVSLTKYNYGDTVTATSGTPQHTSPNGSRGNLLSVNSYTNGSTYLTASMSYLDTGNVQTVTDVNGAQTTYTYGACGNSFPTSVAEPLSLSRSMTWNCTGGAQLTAKDENGQTVTITYNDPDFWRANAVTDQALNAETIAYAAGGVAVTPYYYLNNNNSIVATARNFDGLGRPFFDQRYQSPSGQNFDTVSYTYDSNGRPYSTSMPCSAGAGANCPPATPKTTQTYDALNRPLQTTDGGGGTVSYSYSQNDVLLTIGPAPSGENTKRRQLEYNALGQLTSVCELTTGTGSGTCGQSNPQTGYWTKYSNDPLGNLTSVTQNAQSSAQTRTYVYDLMGRLTSETNPESTTTTYTYDLMPSSCYNWGDNQSGNQTGKTDANGNTNCYHYDSLHRVLDVASGGPNSNPCKRFRYDSASFGVNGSAPSGVSVSNIEGRLMEAETDNCSAWPPTPITDEWFSYTVRGEVSDAYESTPHSGGYYHAAATYWANGVLNQLTAPAGYSTGYNLDGEGRVYSTPTINNSLTATVYNAASLPTQLTYATADTDNFTYDPNTNRMTQYKYTVNGQSVIGTPTWNANGTLAQLAITDPFNSANAQTCTYSHDDLTRIASANCGSAANQTFTYDPFGNINKSGSPYSFQPSYSTTTNRMTSIGGSTPSYDANGNVLNDFLHSYTWDAYGRPITIDGVSVTYDALGRMVEENKSGAYSQFVYAPTGQKIEIMNGQSYVKSFVPLPGGAVAVYTPSVNYYRHPDHLGSSRFASTTSRTMYSDVAYAPFGEPYAQSGSTDISFTTQNQDTVSNLYDFPAREYGIQGRWPSPDPAGLAAADLTDPQSWNRLSYVRNSPLNRTDPLGLTDCPQDKTCWDPGESLGDVLGSNNFWDGRPFVGLGGRFNGMAASGPVVAFTGYYFNTQYAFVFQLGLFLPELFSVSYGPDPDFQYNIQIYNDSLDISIGNSSGGQGGSVGCSVSASSLNGYLSTKNSPMVGEGTNLMNTGAKYNLDPRLLVSLAGAETSFGKNITAGNYNAFNVLYNGLNSPFSSFQAAINSVGYSLTNPRNGYDLSSTATMYQTYCSTGTTCGAGLNNLNTFMRQQGASVNALRNPCKQD